MAGHLLSLQRVVGNRAVGSLLGAQRRLQRDGAGWSGRDIGAKSPNSGSMLVKGTDVRRVPVQGIAGAQGDSDLAVKMHDPVTGEAGKGAEVSTLTGEHPGGGGGGRAIVLIPQWLPKLDTVEVLFFLHGHMIGYRAHRDGSVDDVDLYRFAQQLDEVKPRPMIAILPQGNFYSTFGTGDTRDVDVKGYIAEVLSHVPASEWPSGAPTGPGGIIVSGHSGAGSPIAKMLKGGEMPAGDQLEGMFLFDSINTGPIDKDEKDPKKKKGTDEYTPVRDAVISHLDADLKELGAIAGRASSADAIVAAQHKWLVERGFRFRAYYEGGYTARFVKLKGEIDAWFDNVAAKATPALDPTVLAALRDNYQVLPAGTEHLEAMGGAWDRKAKKWTHENVRDAISHLGTARAAPPP